MRFTSIHFNIDPGCGDCFRVYRQTCKYAHLSKVRFGELSLEVSAKRKFAEPEKSNTK